MMYVRIIRSIFKEMKISIFYCFGVFSNTLGRVFYSNNIPMFGSNRSIIVPCTPLGYVAQQFLTFKSKLTLDFNIYHRGLLQIRKMIILICMIFTSLFLLKENEQKRTAWNKNHKMESK